MPQPHEQISPKDRILGILYLFIGLFLGISIAGIGLAILVTTIYSILWKCDYSGLGDLFGIIASTILLFIGVTFSRLMLPAALKRLKLPPQRLLIPILIIVALPEIWAVEAIKNKQTQRNAEQQSVQKRLAWEAKNLNEVANALNSQPLVCINFSLTYPAYHNLKNSPAYQTKEGRSQLHTNLAMKEIIEPIGSTDIPRYLARYGGLEYNAQITAIAFEKLKNNPYVFGIRCLNEKDQAPCSCPAFE